MAEALINLSNVSYTLIEMIAYNVETAIVDLVFVKGDTINISFDIYVNDVLYNMTGMRLDIDVCKCNGEVVRSFTSSGVLPEIAILLSNFTIYSTSPFLKRGRYKYDVQLTNGLEVSTIMKGNLFINTDYTT